MTMIKTLQKNQISSFVHFTLLLAASSAFVPANNAFAKLRDGSAMPSPDWIVGGQTVSDKDPIAASTVAVTTGSALCSGSIIDTDLLVTAAHCVGPNLYIVFNTNIDQPHANIARVMGYAVSSDWKGPQATTKDQHDIALVRFEGALPEGYRPAKLLPPSDPLKNGEMVTLAGYGETDATSHAGVGVLRKTMVPIKDANFGKTEVLLDQTGDKGACHGDSGGPAFVSMGGDYYLWGVTNRSYPATAADDCKHDSVYTNIDAYKDWLTQAAAKLRAKSE